MPDRTESFNSPSQAAADRLRARGVEAGRWFAGYLTAVGIVSAATTAALETAATGALSRLAVSVAWAALIIVASIWAERHAAYPAGATRLMAATTATWFAAYVLVVGPVVRWEFDAAPVPWAAASLVMAAPFFAAAVLVRLRR